MQSAGMDRNDTVKSRNHKRLRRINHWPCGHERTPENTQSVGSAGVRCRKCRRRINQASRDRLKVDDPETRRLEYKVNYLPIQIANVREKLARLEQEARDLGMHDLVEAR